MLINADICNGSSAIPGVFPQQVCVCVCVCMFQGVFVQLVQANTPAALVGLRFGDQLLQINGESCAGWNSDKAHKALKNSNAERITIALRDRYILIQTCKCLYIYMETLTVIHTHRYL